MANLLTNSLAFLLVFGAIVLVHEAGHLLAAKALRLRVATFSIGFGRTLWKIRRGGTDYRLAALPLGGYVRLGGDGAEELPRDFLSRPRWQRGLFYLAGPAMNVGFSILLFAMLFMAGIDGSLPELPVRIAQVAAGSPAAAAGLQAGDEIRSVAGRPVAGIDGFVRSFEGKAGELLEVRLVREDLALAATLVPLADGNGRGWIGAGYARSFDARTAFAASVRFNLRIVGETLGTFADVFRREVKARDVLASPIAIAAATGDAARGGFQQVLEMMGLLSLAIAIMNLLPIPVLDGGHISILLIEGAIRRDLSWRVKDVMIQAGAAAILLLTVVAVGFDLVRYLPPDWVPGS